MISVCAIGDYAHRQPLAYAQIRDACRHAIRVVARPEQADLVIVAHSKDLDSREGQLRGLARDQRLVLLSEEPFWDTVWGQDPLARDLVHAGPGGALHLTQLNHMTSGIYAFDAIPYFLLTDLHFATRYGLWFREAARLSATDWQRHFAKMQAQVAFVMARRSSPRYEVAFPEAGLASLCNMRTAMAEACLGQGARHFGRGWHEGPARQALTDWHLEKYLTLKGRYRFVGAVENTHQRDYVTEKVFDAWAAGAVPLYVAGPGHRMHDLAVPGSWLNLEGTAPGDLPARLAGFDFDAAFREAYAAQQRRLAALLGDRGVWQAELDRLRQALLAEFAAVLDAPPPARGR